MLVKKITYTDYNGVERTEEFYFNLTQAELIEMDANTPGGYAEKIKMAVKNKDSKTILATFKELVLKSYGEKTEDGRRFIKRKDGEALSDAFAETAAYEALFIELATSENAATEFMNAVLPQINTANKELPVK